MTYAIIGIVALLLLILLSLITKGQKSGKGDCKYQKIPSLLTNNELRFYQDLIKVADNMNLLVFTKVRMADIIEPQKGQNWQAAFNRICSKHLDFVLCDKQRIKPLLTIELDDSSHDRSDRKERDKFVDSALKSANVPLLRVKGSADIAKKIQALLPQKQKA